MSSIKLTELSKKTNLNNNGYTYTDLHLDIQQSNRGISIDNIHKSINNKDIIIDYDEYAIRNSLSNILNTRKGQRFLIPTFGCNLLRFVGMPVSTSTGDMIGREIDNAFKMWEPRVTVDQIIIESKPDENEYDVTVYITIPVLKKTGIKLIGIYTSQGVLEIRNT